MQTKLREFWLVGFLCFATYQDAVWYIEQKGYDDIMPIHVREVA